MTKKTLGKPWQPGQSGNPKGRPPGNRNKLSDAFISALCEDFIAHGAAAIEKVRKVKPEIYLRVIARIIPREMHVRNESVMSGLSDEQLNETISAVRAVLLASTPTGVGEGKATAGSDTKLN
jgi:hypothetical protein